MGSPEFRTIFDWFDAPWRLGLSATPERANDPEGTAAVFGYFGGIVDTYSLKDALDDGVLAPYVYHPSWVSLTEDEQAALGPADERNPAALRHRERPEGEAAHARSAAPQADRACASG